MQFDSWSLVPLGLGTLKSSNHRAETVIIQSDSGSAESWHPQISQSQSWDHYQPIRFRVCWESGYGSKPNLSNCQNCLSKSMGLRDLIVFSYWEPSKNCTNFYFYHLWHIWPPMCQFFLKFWFLCSDHVTNGKNGRIADSCCSSIITAANIMLQICQNLPKSGRCTYTVS